VKKYQKGKQSTQMMLYLTWTIKEGFVTSVIKAWSLNEHVLEKIMQDIKIM
jgi:hypothetical protein